MNIEYEVRALEIDKEKMEEKLLSFGAKKVADFHYKRRVYDFIPEVHNKWIRLRTDGTKTTLTIKHIVQNTVDGTREMEVEVSDFDETDLILNELGYFSRSYQENKRTRYILNGVELDIDTWPYIPTYLEIEGHNSEEVEKIIKLLEIDESKICTLGIEDLYYEIYKIDSHKMSIIKFGEELDDKYRIK